MFLEPQTRRVGETRDPLLRQVAGAGMPGVRKWDELRIHLIASQVLAKLGASIDLDILLQQV